MSWGSPFAAVWNAATDTAKTVAYAAAQTATSAYDYTATKAVQAYDYTKDKAVAGYEFTKDKSVQGYEYAKEKAAQGAVFAKDKAIQGYQGAKRAVAASAEALSDGVKRVAIEARYAQAVGPAAAAKRAYEKAKLGLGLGPAGGAVQKCPFLTSKCASLSEALKKAVLSENAYNVQPTQKDDDELARQTGYRRLDPERDQATLSKLLETDRPDKVLQPSDSDFRASIYERTVNGRVEYVVAFRGTQTGNDWIENGLQGAGQLGAGQTKPSPNRSYDRAKELAKSVSKNGRADGATVSFTGHSLGGGMASAAAAVTGDSATTYNAAGLHANTVGGRYPEPAPQVDAYFTPTDILNGAQDNRPIVLGGVVALASQFPLIGPAFATRIAGWLGSSELQGKPVAPKAYGTRHALPFPQGAKPPELSVDGIADGHNMPRVIAGIKEEQRIAGCP